MRPRFLAVAVVGWVASLWLAPVSSHAEPHDPLAGLLQRTDGFLHRGEIEGVTLDPRRFANFAEQVRLSVVAQLAGYCELHRANPDGPTLQDIVDRADYLVRLGGACLSNDAADGLTAYALLLAYETVGDARYQAAAAPIVAWCMVFDESTASPNRALMAALALAQHHRLTGDPAALAKAQAIVALAARSQNADGSFAHACESSHDAHYTAWIAMQMDRLAELVTDPNVRRVLDQATAFLRERVQSDGSVLYQQIMPTGAVLYYYSWAYCAGDYDTRGWTNELAYHALIFDRYRDSRYYASMKRLVAIESQGAFPDKWGYLPALTDAQYLWASESRSVIRSSLVFWALSCVQSRRISRGQSNYPTTAAASLAGDSPTPVASAEAGSPGHRTAELGPIHPNPTRGGAWISLRHPGSLEVRLEVLDVGGRRVRRLPLGSMAGGPARVRWDGRNDAGAASPPGVYFVRLEADGRASTARFVLIE